MNMENYNRADIIALSEVENLFDISHVSYYDYIKIISGFFDELFDDEYIFNIFNVRKEIKYKIHLYLTVIRNFANNKYDLENLRNMRIDAWKEFDKSNGSEKSILRFILIALYDEVASGHNSEDSSEGFEIIFGTLNDVSPEFCYKFSNFLKKTSLIDKYRYIM